MSGSQAPFKPFQSGCSLCKPSTDYTNYYQNAGGNYSKQGLIPRQASTLNDLKYNGYTSNVGKTTSPNIMSNYGKAYQTTGGKKKSKSKSKKSKNLSKATLNKIKDLGKLLGVKTPIQKVVKTSRKVVKRSVNMGRKVVKRSVNTGRKVVKKSVNTGRKVVKKSVNTGRKVVKRSMGMKKMTKKQTKKQTKKKQRGGDTNWGATGMPARFYDNNISAPEVNSSVYDTETQFGKFSPKSLGPECNLFPFSPYENPPTAIGALVGGKKKNQKKKTKRSKCNKKSKASKNKVTKKNKLSKNGKKQKGGLCLQQGKDLLSSAGGFSFSPRWGKEYCGGAKKRTSPKKKRSQI